VKDRKIFTLKSKLYRSPDNSDIFFTLAVSLGMVRSRATKGDSIVLQEFTDVSGHECCSSISVNKGGQPKDGKEFKQAMANCLRSQIFTRNGKRESRVLIYYHEKVAL